MDNTQPPVGITQQTRGKLLASGWVEGADRSRELAAWVDQLGPDFELSSAARRMLELFGGIAVNQRGQGEECAIESFELVPTLAVDEAERFEQFSSLLGTSLFPLGEAGNGHVFLAAAPDGRVFALMDDLWLVGPDIGGALDNLVLGRRLVPVTLG